MAKNQFYRQVGCFVYPIIRINDTQPLLSSLDEMGNREKIVPISIDATLRFLSWNYGIEIFILPLWKEEDKSLELRGYTYLITKSNQYKHDLWNKIAINGLVEPKDGKKSLAPNYPSKESATVAAIIEVLRGTSTSYISSNEGYLYSLSEMQGWNYSKVPHYTPYMVTLDQEGYPNALFEFNQKDSTYTDVLDKEKSGKAVLQGEFFFLDAPNKSIHGLPLCPITRPELADEIKQQFIPQDEI